MNKIFTLILFVFLSGCYISHKGFRIHKHHARFKYKAPRRFIAPSRIYDKRGF